MDPGIRNICSLFGTFSGKIIFMLLFNITNNWFKTNVKTILLGFSVQLISKSRSINHGEMQTHSFLSQFLINRSLPKWDGDTSTVFVANKFCGLISSYKEVLNNEFKNVVLPKPDSPALKGKYRQP